MILFGKVKDNSMEPIFREGDYIISLPYFFSSPSAGDVIILKHPRKNKLLLKRIEKVSGNEFFVKGDNKAHSEDSRKFGPVKKSHIVGKVVVHVRR